MCAKAVGDGYQRYLAGVVRTSAAVFVLTLAGCAYSSWGVIGIASSEAPEADLRPLLLDLQSYHDGCFSPRRATVDIRETGGKVLSAAIYVTQPDVSVQLALDPETGTIQVRFDEWLERRFTRPGAQCYRQLMTVLEARYGRERLQVQEDCPSGNCLP